ncbi:hypothetical protein HS088_TW19G00785 [Tripterygium wilfordii]|uniref:Hydroxyproline-rich glycoprotein family protein n=1 Tax=Tripterygium wilfordii TaxID=458696 RepID=A0A7J7CAQ7_TRIWF|nr:uncharacterized protein LOC119985870 [Tripterygium wilfordii]KAF5731180.1 hypothetical protein HS088_TW19G00785 [Tripterygium wilfordii]
MRSVNNSSVDTINAAASAIVSAESRVQPTAVQKRRWGSCWNLRWCFGSYKNKKRIGHAVLVPEPDPPGAAVPATENPIHSTAIVLPFIAPPSSPTSFLQSEPPSATQSPAGLLSLTSLSVNAYSPGGTPSIFAIGPYAHETQLVSPPVFSTYTTEPSTASFTPPPESVLFTTPSSPEVPFAQLLTSSLERARRNSGMNQKFGLSHYELQSYQLYPGSPGGYLISPGSAISNSGTSSPFPNKHPVLDFHLSDPKRLGLEHFTTYRWGSRLGSGSLTPDGVGHGSRLGSGSLTPDGMGLGSRLGSGTLTPDVMGQGSRLGSGTLTPDGMGQGSRLGSGTLTPVGMGQGSGALTSDCVGLCSRLDSGALTHDGMRPAPHDGLLENQISEVASLANSENGSKGDDILIHHRVSFELSGEDVARCFENKAMKSTGTVSEFSRDVVAVDQTGQDGILMHSEHCCDLCKECSNEESKKALGESENEPCYRKHRSITLGSTKEFNFDNTKGEVPDKLIASSEWWANRTAIEKEARPDNSWSFFPQLQQGVS